MSILSKLAVDCECVCLQSTNKSVLQVSFHYRRARQLQFKLQVSFQCCIGYSEDEVIRLHFQSVSKSNGKAKYPPYCFVCLTLGVRSCQHGFIWEKRPTDSCAPKNQFPTV